MSSKPIQKRSCFSDPLSWGIRGFVIAGILLFFAVVISGSWLVEIPFRFAFGWFFHLKNSGLHVLGHWKSWLLPLGCLAMATVLIHRFSNRWLIGNGSERRLRPIQTLAVIALVLSGSAAAIALSGIVHQTYWLMGDRWLQSNGRTAQIMAVNDARQLMLALAEFHDLYHRYPNSLRELDVLWDSQSDTLDQLIWVDVNDNRVQEPFILLHPGQERFVNPDEPMIVSPIIGSAGKFVVGYGDTSVRSLLASQFDKILALHGNQQPKPLGPDE